MKWSPVLLAALMPVAFLNSGAFLGPALVLMVTLGIFFGTLSLGRSSASPSSDSPAGRSLTP